MLPMLVFGFTWNLGSAPTPQVYAASVTFYVAPNGNDNWSGSRATPNDSDGPFATLERARDAVRSLKASGLPAGGVTIELRGGVYTRSSLTLTLDSRDSGSQNARIVYRAYAGETPRLVAGRQLDGTHFVPVSDASILQRLPISARTNIRQISLTPEGITSTNIGRLAPRAWSEKSKPAPYLDLLVDGEPLPLARWPNQVEVKGQASDNAQWAQVGTVPIATGTVFSYNRTMTTNRPLSWTQTGDIWVHGFWGYNWADYHARVASVDTSARTFTIDQKNSTFNEYGLKPGMRYYVYNVLEELDAPGEWWVNRATGMLYLWPPSNATAGHDILVSTTNQPLIRTQGASFITFENLTFEAGRGNGIEINAGENIVIAGCLLRNFGQSAVVIQGGTDHGVLSSTIYNVEGGVWLNGGNRSTLTPSRHFVRNTEIYQVGRLRKSNYHGAVLLDGVGQIVENNHFHHMSQVAVMMFGNDHRIQYNVIDHTVMETEDAGAIYSGRSWSRQGNVIRNNLFAYNDLAKNLGIGQGVHTIYLDDGMSGVTITGNIFYRSAMAVRGSALNTIENNVFLESGMPNATDETLGAVVIQSSRSAYITSLIADVQSFNYQSAPWSGRYPRLVEMMTFIANNAAQAVQPYGTSVRNNVFYHNTRNVTAWLPLFSVDYYQSKMNIFLAPNTNVSTDPGVISAYGTEQIRFLSGTPKGAPAGFPTIPIQNIGLFSDVYRPGGGAIRPPVDVPTVPTPFPTTGVSPTVQPTTDVQPTTPVVQPTDVPVPVGQTIRINFQPAGVAVPAGYLADTGAVYGARNGQTYGWSINAASMARDRDNAAVPDQRYDTLIHMQRQPSFRANWELALPNGRYQVRLVSGDPLYPDTRQHILAEGVTIIDGTLSAPTASSPGTVWIDKTKQITVSDGRLTLSNGTLDYAIHNKLCFIEVTRLP